MIPHEYIEEVVRRNDIADVVGNYVQLKRKGRQHSGLCPFHNEKTPSFYLYPDTQSFYCFGCGEGGDVISFIKKIQNLDYVEAVKLLAERAGMPAPSEDDKQGKLRSRVMAVNKDAARFYRLCLNSTMPEAARARAYWRRRGLDDKTIQRFGLGYAPDDFQLAYDHLRAKGYTTEELLESGVVKRSQKGRVYDAFRARVMTPIFDLRGNVIAFGGRVLDDSKPKYINSPETLVYKKSKTMYALNYAKKSPSKRYVLCEGYMDVISMQQAGIDTAVCACGTALTAEQVKLLNDYAEEVVLCYDSDEAGQKATVRSLGLFEQTNLKIKVLKIPDAKDPDEYIKKFGVERFRALLDGTGNEVEFKLGMVREQYDISKDNERIEYLKEATNVLARRPSATEREVYAGRLAEETGVSLSAVLSQIETARRRGDAKQRRTREQDLLQEGIAGRIKVPYQAGGQKALSVAATEGMLLAAAVRNPARLPHILERLAIEDIVMPDIRQIFTLMVQHQKDELPISVASLGIGLDDATRAALHQVVALHSEVTPTDEDVDMYLERIARSASKSKLAADFSLEKANAMMEALREMKA